MRSIFGVDPGLHVGLLHFRVDTGAVEMLTHTPLDAATWLEKRAREGDVVATERYTQTSGSSRRTRQNDALEVIGMCRFVTYRAGAIFVLQGVSEAKKIATPDVIKSFGWWRRGDPDHIRRAAAQAAFAYFQLDPEDFERRTRPGTVV